jgi:flagellar basal-body rod protein FlgC
MELVKTLQISAAGMKAQAARLRVIGENIANSSSTALDGNGEPYRRKTISFSNLLDRTLGFDTVQVASYGVDSSAFAKRYDANHPAAGPDGFVLLPNVNPLIEMADMREAMRSYEANLSVIEASKSMLRKTIELLAR